MKFTSASSSQNTSSQAFTDVPGMSITTDAAGDWAIIFSCVLRNTEPCNIEFKLVADGVDVSNGLRALKVDIIGPRVERCFTLEGKSAPGDAKIIKVQWRTTYGKAIIGDRRLLAFQ
jgi:hypothetical protein